MSVENNGGSAADRIDLEKAVGGRVRTLREVRGLSQAQLGQKMRAFGFPMEQPTVYKLEKGTRPIRLNELAALAAILEVPLDSLWRGPGVGDDPENARITEEWAAALHRYDRALDRRNVAEQTAAALAVTLRAAKAELAEAVQELEAAEAASAAATAKVNEMHRRAAAGELGQARPGVAAEIITTGEDVSSN